jgi:acetoin utilization deacetylase AcuC-like enzyme
MYIYVFTDNLVNLCKLADVQHRLKRASVHDELFLPKLIDEEESAIEAADERINAYKRRVRFLSGAKKPQKVPRVIGESGEIVPMEIYIKDEMKGTVHGTSVGDLSEVSNSAMTSSTNTAPPSPSVNGKATESANVEDNSDDDDKVVDKCFQSLNDELKLRESALVEAERDEEEARRVYEETIQKRKQAHARMYVLDQFITDTKVQRCAVAKVNSVRADIEAYNKTAASQRVSLYRRVNDLVAIISKEVVGKKLASDVPSMFANLVDLFKAPLQQLSKSATEPSTLVSGSMLTDHTQQHGTGNSDNECQGSTNEPEKSIMDVENESSHSSEHVDQEKTVSMEVSSGDGAPLTMPTVSAVCNDTSKDGRQLFTNARIGLETVRLWRQMASKEVRDDMKELMKSFEALLKESMANGSPPTIDDPETSSVYRSSNATVVLYFDHLHHATPLNHVESQARVQTSVQALKGLLQESNGDSRKSAQNGYRTLTMVACNEVQSPPLWVLPLVHSPQYLGLLWSLAQKARKGLLVPLEFETEWESDLMSPFDDGDDESLRLPIKLKRSLTLPSKVVVDVGSKHAQMFTNVMKLREEDEIISRSLTLDVIGFKKERKMNEERRSRIGMAEKRDASVSRMKEKEKPPPVEFSVGARVMTPYGRGTISAVDESMCCVEYSWGAKGYSPRESVTLVPNVRKLDGVEDQKIEEVVVKSALEYREDYSKLEIRPDGRFLFSNMFIVEVCEALAVFARSKKDIADCCGINSAAFSLWLHGRTSRVGTLNYDFKIARWLTYYDTRGIASEFLPLDSDWAEMSASGDEEVATRVSSRLIERTEKVDSDDEESDDSVHQYHRAGLPRALTKKSARPSKPGRSGRSAGRPPRASVGRPPKQENEKKRRRRSSGDPTLRNYSKACAPTPEEDLLRTVLKQAMKEVRTSQTALANAFVDYGEIGVTQGTVSCWFLYKVKEPTFTRYRKASLHWLGTQLGQLSPTHRSQYQDLVQWSENRNSEENFDIDGHFEKQFLPSKLKNGGEDGDSSDLESIDSKDMTNGKSLGSAAKKPYKHYRQKPSKDTPLSTYEITDDDYGVDLNEIEDCEPSEYFPLTAGDLINATFKEMRRRKITQNCLIDEAKLDIIGVPQSTLARILSNGWIPSSQKGKQTCFLLQRWLCVSSKKEAGVETDALGSSGHGGEVEDEASVERFCYVCGRSSRTFNSGKGYHLHVAWCTRKSMDGVERTGTLTGSRTDKSPRALDAAPRHVLFEQADTILVPKNEDKTEVKKEPEEPTEPPSKRPRRDSVSIKKEGLGERNGHHEGAHIPMQECLQNLPPPTSASPPAKGGVDEMKAQSMLEYDPDSRLVAYFVEKYKKKWNKEITDNVEAMVALKTQCANAKSALSVMDSDQAVDQARVEVDVPGVNFSYILTNDELTTIVQQPSNAQNHGNECGEESASTSRMGSDEESDDKNDHSAAAAIAIDDDDGDNDDGDNDDGDNDDDDDDDDDDDENNTDDKNSDHGDDDGDDNDDDNDDDDDDDDNDDNSEVKSGDHEEIGEIQDDDKDASSDTSKAEITIHDDDIIVPPAVFVVDGLSKDFQYQNCDFCQEKIDDSNSEKPYKKCSECPCVFHMKCLQKHKQLTSPDADWVCSKCKEVDASDSTYADFRNMPSHGLKNQWILIYSHLVHHRRWRKAYVLRSTLAENSLIVKWWNVGDRWGKSAVVDLSAPDCVVKITSAPALADMGKLLKLATVSGSSKVPKPQSPAATVEKVQKRGKRPRSVSFPMDNADGVQVMKSHALLPGGVGLDDDAGRLPPDAAITDTYISRNTLQAALCTAGTACRAVDIAMCGNNTNVFACTRPPGHHAGRYGTTAGCTSTGFCLLNNAAIALVYARVRWGLERVAVVDIDVHFGNGTAELLRGDPNAFFASVHMIYGDKNVGLPVSSESIEGLGQQQDPIGDTAPQDILDQKPADIRTSGFYPSHLGATEVTDNYVSVGVFPPPQAVTDKKKHTRNGARNSIARKVTMSEEDEEAFDDFADTASKASSAADVDVDGDDDVNASEKAVDMLNVADSTDDDVLTPEEDAGLDTDKDADAAARMEVETPTEKPFAGVENMTESDTMMNDEAGADSDDTRVNSPGKPLEESCAGSDGAQEPQTQTQSQSQGQCATELKALSKLHGAEAYRYALSDIIVPQLEKFKPQLLIISAGFDGYVSDPLGGELHLSLDDYAWSTKELMGVMDRVSGQGKAKVVSLLEGGYDVAACTQGLAKCVVEHVKALKEPTDCRKT